MLESSITTKGQTTIPKAVRDFLALSGGDKVRYVLTDNGVRIFPVRPTSRLYRSIPYDGLPATLEDMERAIAERATEE